jgi:hypothetical protein
LCDLLFNPTTKTIILPPKPSTDLEEAMQKIDFPKNFWQTTKNRIATALGVTPKRVLMFENFTYIRMKCNKGSTKAHSDFYHLFEFTDTLSRLRKITKDDDKYDPATKLCVVCMRREGLEFEHVALCRSCADGYIPLFTAWISLGNYSNTTHALLQMIPKSQEMDYSHIDEDAVLQRELPKDLKIRKKDWVYVTEEGMSLGDMVLFNCKTVHRAEASKKKPRMSIDVRFGILPVA